MAAPKNLQDYLKSLPDWKSASKEVNAAKADVSQLNTALSSAPQSSKASIKSRLDEAQSKLNTATAKLNKVQSEATSYYNANPDKFASQVTSEKVSEGTKNVEDAIRTKEALIARGASAAEIAALDKRINELQGKVSSGFQESPKPGGIVSGEPNVGTEAKPEDFAAKLKTARDYVKNTLDANGRLQLAKSLVAAGIETPLTGEFTEALAQSYSSAISKAQGAYNTNKEFTTVADYLNDQIRQVNAIKGAGGAGGTDVAINISSPTDAESLIQSTFKSVLGRQATSEELGSFAKQLNKAERAAGRKATKVGNRTEYTSDLNREQFLTNEIKKITDPKTGKSEYETKKAEKEGLTAQSLRAVAKLNGINLSQAQLDAYSADIRNGKDVNVIKNNIRQMAGLGRPDSIKKLLAEGTDLDTIYSPYKTTMASLLEVPADQIDLNDATLQGAIGPDKEMPLYEFRKALKKDNRWQYTNNAKKEVSDNVLRVLKDFGFQG
jgi:hypothetical protein